MENYNRKDKLVERYSLIAIDIVCIVVSYLAAFWLRYHRIGGVRLAERDLLVVLLLVTYCLLFSLMSDWNKGFFARGLLVEFAAVVRYQIGMMVYLALALYLVKLPDTLSRLLYGYFLLTNLTVTYLTHLFFKKFMCRFYRHSSGSDKVLVVTGEKELEQVMENIRKDVTWSYEVVGIAVVDADLRGRSFGNVQVLATGDGLLDFARKTAIDVAFLYLPRMDRERASDIIGAMETMGITCHYGVDTLGIGIKGKSAGEFAGYLVVTYAPVVVDYRSRFLKRMIDVIGSVAGLLVTAVLFPFIALAIRLDSPGPVFFVQTRVGKNGRRFQMYKFRSMCDNAEARKEELQSRNEMQGLMFKVKDDPRITRVGKFLRRTSLDELPQFWNVLKGDMSLVGTRPPTVDEFEKYSDVYRRRMSITPGMTGLWQVSGRSDVTDFDDVVRYDLAYIDHWSLLLDFKILLLTVKTVLAGKGAK